MVLSGAETGSLLALDAKVQVSEQDRRGRKRRGAGWWLVVHTAQCSVEDTKGLCDRWK